MGAKLIIRNKESREMKFNFSLDEDINIKIKNI